MECATECITVHLVQQAPPAADGWLDGAPLHIAAAVVQMDVRSYRGYPCDSCRKRRLKLTPQHHGLTGAYRLLGTCGACAATQVF